AAAGAALRRFGAASPLRLGLDDPGRHTAQTADLVGRLGTACVVPFRVDGGVDAATLATRAREALAESTRAPVPLAVLADLRPDTWGAEPLLPVGLDTVTLPAPRLGGGPARIRLMPSPVPMYDLELILTTDGNGSAELLAEYDPDLFDHGTIDALTALVTHFLDPAVHAASPLPGSPVVSPAPDGGEGFGGADVFAGWVDRPPDDVVVGTARGGTTAARVAAEVRATRQALAEAGARAGDAVVLHADDSAGSVAALLGALGFGVDVSVRCAEDPPSWSDAVEEAARARYDLFPNGTVVARAAGSGVVAADDGAAAGREPGALLVGLRAHPFARVLR
ncbi:hypothetical protein, partial [Streptomyces sp. SID3343]|uniref:hypothetical protein n=1 Tax=Streptomyces sp. SID3343 TaxID=2690260 RepID=UPI00136C1204